MPNLFRALQKVKSGAWGLRKIQLGFRVYGYVDKVVGLSGNSTDSCRFSAINILTCYY